MNKVGYDETPRIENEQADFVQSEKDDGSKIDREMSKNIDRGNDAVKDLLNRFSEPFSLDYSPSSSTVGSEELDSSMLENDAFERESGVESVDGDWPQTCSTPPSYYDLDLTEEQALETLKYFTLSVSRANQMTKTHQDLEAVLHLLQEKEKDLELAAHIGQSLLERNRNLYKKTETLESYVNEVEERETQLKHVVSMKDKLLKTFLHDEDVEGDDEYSPSDSSAYESCRDESMLSLHEKCNQLEAHNTSLVLEALKLREQTDKEEEKEKQLVYECIKELGEAKDQISHLTDEISQKAGDNLEQQEEISKLISTVLELQERHNQLTGENEELHETLKHSQENQKDLKVEVSTLHEKYQECFEMLMENQREMKIMKEKLSLQNSAADPDSCPQGLLRQDPRDSLAQEIEETVRRDLETSQEKKKHTNRVMQTVRAANTAKRFPKAIKGGSRPGKNSQPKNEEKPFDFSFAASASPSRTERSKDSAPSIDELRAAVRRLSVSENAPQGHRGRRAWAPEKLQIVKPMEGSATLHKWQSLARPTMSGLHDVHPGVHVKGETTIKTEHVIDRSSRADDKAGVKNKRQVAGLDKDKTPVKVNTFEKNDVKRETATKEVSGMTSESSGKMEIKPKNREVTSDKCDVQLKNKPAGDKGVDEKLVVKTTNTPLSENDKSVLSLGGDCSAGGTPSNLTEIVKSKLSAEEVVTPDKEPASLLNKILHSTAGISASLVTSIPVTTTAKTSFVATTTTSSSVTVSAFPRPLHVRSRSSENLLDLMKPFNHPGPVETMASPSDSRPGSSISTDNLSASTVVPNPSTSSPGLGGFVGRLVRSTSNENLAGIKNDGPRLSRSSSSGKLSDLLKNSDIASAIGKPSSFDTVHKDKRASFHLGNSPPSPSQLEMMGDLGTFAFFGTNASATPTTTADSTTTTTPSLVTSTSRTVFGALSGLGGFFRPRSKSMDNLGPLPASFSSPTPSASLNSGGKALAERSVERFHQLFGPN